MTFNTYIEMPSGALSRPHEDATEAAAQQIFNRFVEIMEVWTNWSVDVVMTDGKTELRREHIENA